MTDPVPDDMIAVAMPDDLRTDFETWLSGRGLVLGHMNPAYLPDQSRPAYLVAPAGRLSSDAVRYPPLATHPTSQPSPGLRDCRECREGKHPNCNGETWDEGHDCLAACPCDQRGHRP